MKENMGERTFSTKIRVRYSETDKMGFCYYGNYAAYFEVARVEALRELGIVYKKLEDNGILLPVTELNIRYKQAAKYDDVLEIKTTISKLQGTRIAFRYETWNEEGALLNEADTTLVFMDATTRKPMAIPTFIQNAMNHE
ncbi:MAG: putative acyl-CoA thioesterase YneP [Bacteroidota bacterium]|mgnify:FL=1|jgi:acyl-CoA thioester hydrolase